KLSLNALEGSATGEVEVNKWQSIFAETEDEARKQAGKAHIVASGIQLGAVARALGSKVHFVGKTKGTVDLTWKGSPRNAEGAVELESEPPSQPRPDQVPVNARVVARFDGAREQL